MMKPFLLTLSAIMLAAVPARAAQHELHLYDTPRVLPHTSFADDAGHQIDISAFAGKVVVLDFWATWCLPCRTEFPALDRLQQKLGPQGVLVVPVSVDRKGMPAVDKFYGEVAVKNLGKYLDDSRDLAQAMGVRGLPTTLVINAEGQEVARVEGPAEWDSSEIEKTLQSLVKR